VLNDCLPFFYLEEIPSYTSIANWVQKSGYAVYEERGSVDYSDNYGVIVDESMMVGSEKLLLTLGVPAVKKGTTGLSIGDVKVLDMSVDKSWDGARIGKVLEKVSSQMDSPPSYVVSDNASTIRKAVRDKGYIHLRDIGHTFGLILQQVYGKVKIFQSFIKSVTRVKFQEIMRPTAYLLPPKQRTIARFMNLSGTVQWAESMLKSLAKLNDEEKHVFSFIKKYKSIIEELAEVFQVVNPVLQQLKNEGISKESLDWALPKIQSLTASRKKRISTVGQLMEEYMTTEYNKVAGLGGKVHISSDVIESMFGYYKGRKSPNTMNGVTKQIFFLPIMTKIKSNTKVDDSCIKMYLENVFLHDLDDWRKKHLFENRTVKRRKLLSA
jgi:hypothetical protein